MYTSFLALALTGLTAAAQGSDAPAWLTDYQQGRKLGMSEGKPLVVVVASGKDGWNKLSKAGSLGKQSSDLLAGKYVCVYLDIETPEGKRMAEQLDLNQGIGIVISDHTGRLMAFHHEGNLAEQNLTSYLNRYSDPSRVVARTDTNPSATTRTSNYPTATEAPVYAPAPVYGTAPAYIPSFGGSSCPNCRR